MYPVLFVALISNCPMSDITEEMSNRMFGFMLEKPKPWFGQNLPFCNFWSNVGLEIPNFKPNIL